MQIPNSNLGSWASGSIETIINLIPGISAIDFDVNDRKPKIKSKFRLMIGIPLMNVASSFLHIINVIEAEA